MCATRRRPSCCIVRPGIQSNGCASASATRSTRACRAAGVLAALAVGDQGAIEHDDWNLYRNTGIAHLVSISGLHITMFAWLAGVVIGKVWRRSVRASLWWPAPNAA